MLTSVIVDDEPKAIQGLSWELSNFSDQIKVTATFNEPEKALIYLAKNNIDCLFLDIEMPTMDGFQFLSKLKSRDFAVVITTAYNEYAIKALKNDAIDYLLKPIDTDDLEETIAKVKKYNFRSLNSNKVEKVLLNFNKKLDNKKITINTDGKLIFLEPKEILFIVSDGNYSTIHTIDTKKIVVTKKLKEVNALLPDEVFFRIHNSYIINLKKVKEFYKTDGYVILENNHKIPVSRQKKAEFLDKF
ncbi:LytR/AlgR family response regulator transcription factor [Polaribacter sp. Hel1_85]|uniref:LytR/AlgR family response regulator transcription factor n=1 Tax=Polaribacter sp. Hel1_85 TaxID=1250005 RepID=UPI00052BA647|nr:LytTR family DNA-binding domain-containing protein [Polaribacter sp. Hel1_85]KGL62620.1 two-component system response regulator [Polaribacter sp. Hel1_85]